MAVEETGLYLLDPVPVGPRRWLPDDMIEPCTNRVAVQISGIFTYRFLIMNNPVIVALGARTSSYTRPAPECSGPTLIVDVDVAFALFRSGCGAADAPTAFESVRLYDLQHDASAATVGQRANVWSISARRVTAMTGLYAEPANDA